MSDTAAHSPAAARPRPGAGTRSAIAVVLGWLVPGLGHVYLGWWRRGLLYMGIVLFMFGFGLWLDGGLSTPVAGSYLSALASFADAGAGPLYFIGREMSWGAGRVTSATHEVGNTFHWSAGVMNMLLLLDAFDIAQDRK